MIKIWSILVVVVLSSIVQGQQATTISNENKRLLFQDDFSGSVMSNQWMVETNAQDVPGCSIVNGQLQLETKGGITLWYKTELIGNSMIEYDRMIVMEDGENDRLSDLNQFWMVADPQHKMFKRKGGFREYDSLQMYYVGMGGNYNSTTRMRRYDGKGQLQIVGEYKDTAHLLQPNKKYHISIIVKEGVSKFIVDGIEYFSFKDDHPFTKGWFAIRSTKSRQLIDNVKIWQLN
jgi:Domain of unknown function (DUF6250)